MVPISPEFLVDGKVPMPYLPFPLAYPLDTYLNLNTDKMIIGSSASSDLSSVLRRLRPNDDSNPNQNRIPRFPPLPAALPSRDPCGEHCNAQLQCAFLTRVPAEIRNEIYRYVFSGWSAPESLQAAHHPLSLLLSCHMINHEATNLAFNTYAFVLSPYVRTMYVTFKIQMSHLSSAQINAITTLAYDLGARYTERGSETANMLTNAILLLPRLKYFELHVRSGERRADDIHSHMFSPQSQSMEVAAIEKYAPQWLNYKMLQRIIEGSTFAWQKGQKWRVEWPQLKSEDYLYVRDDKDLYGQWRKAYWMDRPAVGEVRGVTWCPCTCNNVSWTSADLVQETGRVVHVDTYFSNGVEYPRKVTMKPGKLGFYLQPGAKPAAGGEEHLPDYKLSEDTRRSIGSSEDVNEEYFERLRKKNFGIRTILRQIGRIELSKQQV